MSATCKWELDHYGYPSEEVLSAIRSWPMNDGPAMHGKCMLERIREIWHNADWGFDNDESEYRLSTGGWSGNEDIISAMAANVVFWGTWFHSMRRGGHYVFRLEG